MALLSTAEPRASGRLAAHASGSADPSPAVNPWSATHERELRVDAERERNVWKAKYEALEQQVTTVNEKLEAVRSAVNQLVLKKQEPSADEIIDQDASAALSGLGSIEQLTTASAEAAA